MKKVGLLLTFSALVLCTLASCGGKDKGEASSTSVATSEVVTSATTSVEVTSVATTSATPTSAPSTIVSTTVAPTTVVTSAIPAVDPKYTEFKAALEKDYSNVTVEMEQILAGYLMEDGERNDIMYATDELDKIKSANEFFILYEANESEPYGTYVHIGEEFVNIYDELEDGTYSNTKMSAAEYGKVFSSGSYKWDYAYLAFTGLDDLGIDSDDYEVVNGHIYAKEDALQDAGYALLGFDKDEEAIINSIEISVENGYLASIEIEYEYFDATKKIDGQYTYTFSDVGTTTFTFPDVEEEEYTIPGYPVEYYDPKDCVALSIDDLALLTTTFGTDFKKYICEFVYYYDDGTNNKLIDETDYMDMESFSFYIDYYASINDGESSAAESYYLYVSGGKPYYVTVSEDDEKLYEHEQITSKEFSSLAPYAMNPADFATYNKFAAADFIKVPSKENSKVEEFIVSEDKLDKYAAQLVDEDETLLSVEVDFYDGVVSAICYLVMHEDAFEVSYKFYAYYYDEIGTAEVDIPEPGESALWELDEDDEFILEYAFTAVDYSNCTVYDEIFPTLMYFDGIDSYAMYYNSNGELCDFLMTYDEDEDKYYEYDEEGNPVEIEKVDYDHVFFRFFVDEIDLSDIKYYSANGTYYISSKDINMEDFIPYYDDPEFIDSIVGLEFVINEDGEIVKINVEFIDDDGDLVTGKGIEIFDIGTTNMPFATEDDAE